MPARPDYVIDIAGVPTPAHADASSGGRAARPAGRWLAITWECCQAYSRIYRTRDGAAYAGRCPKCARAVRVPIGPGGTDERFFRAG